MNGDYEPLEGVSVSRRRPLLVYLLFALVFFLLGLAAMGWALSRWDTAANWLGLQTRLEATPTPVQAQPAPQPAAVQPAQPAQPQAATEPERIVIDPEITRRVALIEQRIGQIDTQSRTAVGNADRAEGLLVAFAARRALDRGVSLGYLEALLRQRFAATQPQAVGTIITAAREPVTLQELQDGLRQVAPQLTGAGPQKNWWQAFQAELGGLITVRREGTPSPEPRERLRRATQRLEAGQVDVALAEVLRLPGRDNGREWIADARRYVIARRALDTIETAALLEPRTGQVPAAAPSLQPAPAARR